MKQLKNPKNLLAIALLCITVVVFFVVFIQAQTEDEDDGCRWHVQSQKQDGDFGNYVLTGVNALYWNDCGDEIYHIYRDSGDSNWEGTVRTRKINL